MPGLKKHFPEFQFSGAKVSPDEIDRYQYTHVFYPSAGTAFVGTAAAGTATQAKALVMLGQQLDYPRNVKLDIAATGTAILSGTCHLVGTDQFGKSQTEDISCIGTATVDRAGTKIFKSISAGTVTFGTSQGTCLGTATVGVAIGTAADKVAKFGLGYKIGATSDVKTITWIDNGTSTPITAGTVVSTLVDATNYAFQGTKIVAATDIYVVQGLPTYNAQSESNNAI
jgi:hypothetical protein